MTCCPTCGQDWPMEWWIIKSEEHLANSGLAYWGPWSTKEKAASHPFAADTMAVVVSVPKGNP